MGELHHNILTKGHLHHGISPRGQLHHCISPKGHSHHSMHQGDIRIIAYLQGYICIMTSHHGIPTWTFASWHTHKGAFTSWHTYMNIYIMTYLHEQLHHDIPTWTFASWHPYKKHLHHDMPIRRHLHHKIFASPSRQGDTCITVKYVRWHYHGWTLHFHPCMGHLHHKWKLHLHLRQGALASKIKI